MGRWVVDPSFKSIILLLALVVLATLIVGSVMAQDTELPDEITIETVDGEDADQVNDLDLEANEPFDVTMSGVEEFDERFEWIVRIDGDVVDRETAEDATVSVRLDSEALEPLEAGEEYELEVALEYRDEDVRDTSTIRVASIHDPREETRDLPEEITIETVDGEDADQVNDLDLEADELFDVTMSGVEEFDERLTWIVRLDGDVVDQETAEGATVSVRLDSDEIEPLEEGVEYDLEVALEYRDDEVSDTSTIRVASIVELREAEDGRLDSEIITLRSERSGIPMVPQPTQEITLTGQFQRLTEPHDMTVAIHMFGDIDETDQLSDGLPGGIDVTAVSADSDAWPVEATPTDEGIELEIHGDGGPESGEIHLTIEFDASEAYEEFQAAEHGTSWTPDHIQYRIEDEAGDTAGAPTSVLWGMPLHVVVETPDGERVTPNTDSENWREYYERRTPPYDPIIDVFVGDGELVTTSRTVPTADGVWSLVHTEDRYLRVNADEYADPVVPHNEIDPQAHTDPENPYVLELSEGEALEVTMTDHNGEPLPDGFLELEDEDGIRYDLKADDDGVVGTPLQPGEYTGTAMAHTALPEWEIDLVVEEGDVTREEFVLTAPEVVDSNIEHVGGTEPDVDSMAVDSIYYEGAMMVSLMPDGADPITRTQVDQFGVDKDPHDIADLGVDETTELRLTLDLDGFEPDTLMWAARDAAWEIVETDGDRTVVEIETKATEIQKIDEMRTGFGDEDSVDWPTGDADIADEEFEAVVEVWLWDFEELFDDAGYMTGTSLMTNAQIFSPPVMEDGELSIYMAAPAKTVDGEQHTGYYQAYLSDEVLEEWNIEDPENDLQVVWAGEDEQFHVESVEGGVYIEVEPVHFSDGEMEIRSLTYEPEDSSIIPGVPWYVLVVGIVLLVVAAVAVIVLRNR